MLKKRQHDLIIFICKNPKKSYPPDFIILLQYLVELGKVQTLEATHFHGVIFKAPIFGLERNDFVDLFQELRYRDTVAHCKKRRSDC